MARLWAQGGLYVDVELSDTGTLRFSGQDLRDGNVFGRGEYEYELTVGATDVRKVVEALGGAPGVDVIDLLVANAEPIIQTGEMRWLQSLGIKPGFWSRAGD